MTLSFGTRYEYFPLPTRIGSRSRTLQPRDQHDGDRRPGRHPRRTSGVRMQKNLFSPRARSHLSGHAGLGHPGRVRHHQRSVLAGAADANEPSRPARTWWTRQPTPSRGFAASRTGSRSSRIRISASGIIPVPGNVTVVTLPDDFERGRVESWNVGLRAGTPLGTRGRGRLCRHATGRPAGRARAELVADRRRQQRAAARPAIRTDRLRRSSSRRSGTRTTTPCRHA